MRGFIPLIGINMSKPIARDTFKALLEKFAEWRKKTPDGHKDGAEHGGRKGFRGPRASAGDRLEKSKND